MKIKNYIFRTAVACCMGLAFAACGDDDLDRFLKVLLTCTVAAQADSA